MVDADFIFVAAMTAAALLFGLFAARQDYLQGRISNRLVLGGAAFAVAANFGVAAFFYFFLARPQAPDYLWSFSLNAIFSLLVGFALWELKLWTAGDAKLFAAMAALLPLEHYSKGYLPFFPSYALLVNSLLPVAGFLVLETLAKTTAAEKFEVARQALNPLRLASSALFLFWFAWAAKLAAAFAGIELGVVPSLAAAVIAFYFIVPKIPLGVLLKVSIAFSAACLFAIFFSNDPAQGFLEAGAFLAFSLALMAAFSFLQAVAHYWFGSVVNLADLKPGMALELDAVEKGKRASEFDEFLRGFKGPLSERDIAEIRARMRVGNSAPAKVPIRQYVPFAPFLLLGAAITVLINQSLLGLFLSP